MKTCGWLKWFVLSILAMAVPVCSAAVVPITGVTCDQPNGTAPYNLLSIAVGDYTATAEQLGVGTSSIVPGGALLSRLDNLDLSDGYSTSAGTTFKTVGFGGATTWKDSNGDNPDFFIFESGGEDSPAIAAILPGGVLGQAVTVSGKWGQTNYNRPAVSVDGEAMQNQPIVGFALAITDLLDASGQPLTNNSVIEGLQTTRNGMDPMTYCAVMPPALQARDPSPVDKALDVLRDAILSWEPAESAETHDVYFATSFDAVDNASRTAPTGVLVSQGQDATSYDPGALLVLGQTYYWRIDEVDASSTVVKGHVWSFTVEPYAYPIRGVTATASSSQPGMGPEKTIDGSGLAGDLHGTEPTAMWLSLPGASAWIQYEFAEVYKLYDLKVWNSNQIIEPFLGMGAKKVAIETSLDGTTWTALAQVPQFAQAPGQTGYAANTTVSLDGVVAKYVKLTINAPWGGAGVIGLSEVRFSHVPVRAFEPEPQEGAVGVGVEADLVWRAGREAASHQVYLSTDSQAVAEGAVSPVTAPEPRVDALLDLGRTYYWKVVEVNEAESPASWEGEVWTFATADRVVVDDFESYNDAEDQGTRIYETWSDGYNTTTNGSQVGYIEAPFAEQTIVHGGKQSLPLSYDNTGGKISEATRTFDSPQDWTRHGIVTLVLHFYGDPANPTGQIYVKLNGTKVVYSGVANALKTPYWTQWNIDLASVGAGLKAITRLTIGVEGGGQGIVYVDDILLYGTAPQPPTELLWIEAESGTITNPMGTYDDATASGGKYIGTENLGITGGHVDGIATYPITVKGGTYRIFGRVVDMPSGRNSFWVRIKGATLDTVPDADGWCSWNFPNGAAWHWDDVSNGTNSLTDPPVWFTLSAGSYVLEIAYREDGARLDAIVITDAAD